MGTARQVSRGWMVEHHRILADMSRTGSYGVQPWCEALADGWEDDPASSGSLDATGSIPAGGLWFGRSQSHRAGGWIWRG